MGKKFDGILDYIGWRGDLPFSKAEFCEVDALIFAQLSYLNLSGIVPGSFGGGITLSEAAERFARSEDFAERRKVGLVINPLSWELLSAAGRSARFGGVVASGYEEKFDGGAEEQFSAVTFSLGGGMHVAAFRGTDDTIVGWKEDFNLAFRETVPAQVDAADYLSRSAAALGGEFVAAGHSKGGNLAVFSAAALLSSGGAVRAAYNFDGPGFTAGRLSSEAFARVRPLVRSFYPQLSIVGMLFEHFPEFSVVESSATLAMQHDPFTWAVRGPSFVRRGRLDAGSEFFSRTFNGWLSRIDGGARESFVDAVFAVVGAAGGGSLTEIRADSLRSSAAMARAFASLDDGTRGAVLEIAGGLIKEARRNLSSEPPALPS